ncbi:hypothetical protein GCM10022251_77180 [Phytohabitans flavus]|uniref:Uncharacterized protein n=1 Tax=Phytohabitans flavus TaxID=1076124 RepID=A0A6F8XLN3_9ACTN|nr:hypothetical protein [Phytohabitans flavus]BCB74708.1 hypothetical protein Pflav_011180 [Phytohabitans flavus]
MVAETLVGSAVVAEVVAHVLLVRTTDDDPEPYTLLANGLPVETERPAVLFTPTVSRLDGIYSVLPEILAEHLKVAATALRLVALSDPDRPGTLLSSVSLLARRIGIEILAPIGPLVPGGTGTPAWVRYGPDGSTGYEPAWTHLPAIAPRRGPTSVYDVPALPELDQRTMVLPANPVVAYDVPARPGLGQRTMVLPADPAIPAAGPAPAAASAVAAALRAPAAPRAEAAPPRPPAPAAAREEPRAPAPPSPETPPATSGRSQQAAAERA